MVGLRYVVLLGLIAAALGDDRLCAPSDFTDVYETCESDTSKGEEGVRGLHWAKTSDTQCRGKDTIKAAHKLPCACQITEYRPILGECEGGRRKITGYAPTAGCLRSPRIEEALCKTPPDCGHTLCDCTEDDIGFMLTDDTNTTKRKTYHWKLPCFPPKGLRLPDPHIVSNDDMLCGDGYYWGSSGCTKCPAGTYAIAGEVYGPPWNDKGLPSSFHTFCGGAGCEPWQAEEDYIYSGSHVPSAVGGGLSSSLVITAEIQAMPALFTFTYRVEGGSLEVFFNRHRVFVNTSNTWTTTTLDLVEDVSLCSWELTVSVPSDKNFTMARPLCMFRNRLMPYNPVQHFSDTEGSQHPLYSPKGGCHTSDYSVDKKEWHAVILDSTRNCSLHTAIRAAQDAGAKAVFVLASTETHVDEETDGSGVTIPVAFIDAWYREDLEAFLAKISSGEDVMGKASRRAVVYSDVEIEMVFETQYDQLVSEHDAAYISEIQITGTVPAAPLCTPCPKGTFSSEGAEKCSPCPGNTYAPTTGQAEKCLPCPGHHTSAPGQARCTPTPNCTKNDYVARVSSCKLEECKEGEEGCVCKKDKCTQPKHSIVYEAEGCSVDNAKDPPPPQHFVPCLPCSDGYFRNSSLQCEACPPGTASVVSKGLTAGLSCTTCDKGMYAFPIQRFTDFRESLGAGVWSTKCTTRSGGVLPKASCWPLHANTAVTVHDVPVTYYSAGKNLYDVSDVVLELSYRFRVIMFGHVRFRILLEGRGEDVAKISTMWRLYSFAERRVHEMHQGIESESWVESSILPPGEYEIMWHYSRKETTATEVVLYLTHLEIEGAEGGGAASCSPCKAGLWCKEGAAGLCSPGEYSEEAVEHCKPCPDGQVAWEYGASACHSCSKGLHAVSKRYCMPPATCTFEFLGTQYPLGHDEGTFSNVLLGSENGGNVLQKSIPFAKINLCQHIQGGSVAGFAVMTDPDTNTSYSLGQFMQVGELQGGGLSFTIDGGDYCVKNPSTQYSAVIDVMCGEKKDISLSQYNASQCRYLFTASTPSICPTCTDNDFKLVESLCHNGMKKQYYVRKSVTRSLVCTGGAAEKLSEPKKVPCDEHEVVDNTAKHTAMIAVGVVTVLVVVLMSVFAVHYRRKTAALQWRYSHLTHSRSAGQEGDAQMLEMIHEDVAREEVVEEGTSPRDQSPPPVVV